MSIIAGAVNDQKNVLIVEDDEHIAYLLDYMLQREGFATVCAADGRQAELIIESESPPALVVLDYMLPYRNGLELITMIRARQEWKDVPVMMLTAKSQEESSHLKNKREQFSNASMKICLVVSPPTNKFFQVRRRNFCLHGICSFLKFSF